MEQQESDPYGRAKRDCFHDEQDEPLVVRDGDRARDAAIEAFSFDDFEPDGDVGQLLVEWLEAPLLDVGAGTGRHALYFQERFETVAIDVSEHLVETMRERGVTDARHADMFSLTDQFERDRFRSALVWGGQIGLAGSMSGLRSFLGDLAHVTDEEAVAVLQCEDPEAEAIDLVLGYRPEPAPGLAHRAYHYEYEGDVGETLLFRLFSPDRLREAVVGTPWEVVEVERAVDVAPSTMYAAVLAKAAN